MGKIALDGFMNGAALCTWFQAAPTLQVAQKGAPGRLVAHTIRLSSGGYLPLTKHMAVTFNIFDIADVGLAECCEAELVDGLGIEATGAGITLKFESSYGVRGWIKAQRITVSFAG